MINYETFNKIKLCKNDLQMNIEQIASSLNLSWATVDKWAAMPAYEVTKKTGHKRTSKLDPFKPKIVELLGHYPDYSAPQIKDLIDKEGYEGSLTIIKRYLRSIRPKTTKAFLSLHFPPGESAQVDWGCAGYIMIEGKKRKVSYFVIVLCHSRLMHVTFTLSEAQEFWLDCHRRAFEYFGGVPSKIMVDNCKTAVLEHPIKGVVKFNPKYIDFANHYGFEIVACNVRQPQEKGRVENGVGYVRNNFINGRRLEPFPMLNIDVKTWIDETANCRVHGSTGRSPLDMFEEEEKLLKSLPIRPYNCCRWVELKVNKLFRIRLDTNTYSAPPEFTGRTIRVEASCDKVRLFANDFCIAEHQRCFSKNKDIENPAHAQKLIKNRRQADKTKHLEMFFNLGDDTEPYWDQLNKKFTQPLLEIRKILALCSSYSPQEVYQALQDSASYKAFGVDYIKNILASKQRTLPEAAPLHVPHKTDDLNISLPEPDISHYR